MKTLIAKTLGFVRRYGVVATLGKFASYLDRQFRYRHEGLRWKKDIFSLPSADQRFTAIYAGNYWKSGESASGHGSSLEYTARLRARLPEIVRAFSIESIFDAPCGDFNWMRVLLPQLKVHYVGADIVQPLVHDLAERFSSENVSFIRLDLTEDSFPVADLMICRDCLFHLSYEDTNSVLRNFVESGIRYLFTSTHVNREEFVNRDITTGDFRRVDLFSAPYHFPRFTLAEADDWIWPYPERKMYLWSREQIEAALLHF